MFFNIKKETKTIETIITIVAIEAIVTIVAIETIETIVTIKKQKRLTKNSQPFLVPGAGLEPAQPQWPKDFKSFVSTIPPSGR